MQNQRDSPRLPFLQEFHNFWRRILSSWHAFHTIESLAHPVNKSAGIPKTVVFDNAKCVVLNADWHDPELHPKINEFCKHYGFCVNRKRVQRLMRLMDLEAIYGDKFPPFSVREDVSDFLRENIGSDDLVDAGPDVVLERQRFERIRFRDYPLHGHGSIENVETQRSRCSRTKPTATSTVPTRLRVSSRILSVRSRDFFAVSGSRSPFISLAMSSSSSCLPVVGVSALM